MGPKSLNPKALEVKSQKSQLLRLEVVTYHFTQHPKYDMGVYMATKI